MSQEQLKTIFEELGYPGALKFRAAVKKRGLDITFSAAARFVAKHSQRQVLAREPDYGGKVTASQLNGRWAADLISYVAQPAGDFTHILVVQDIFSRMIYTEALKSAKTQETIEAFGRITGRANAYPIELNTDKGSEFASREFQAMLKRFGIIYRQGRTPRYIYRRPRHRHLEKNSYENRNHARHRELGTGAPTSDEGTQQE